MKLTQFSIIISLLYFIYVPSLCYAQDYMQWELPEGAKYRIGKGNIVGVKFTSDGNRLIVDTAIGLWIYDIHTGIEIDFIHENRPYNYRLGSSLGVSQNAEMYVTIDNESTFTVRKLRDSSPIYKFHEQTDNIRQVVFSPEGNILAVCNNNLINLWDLNTGIKIHTLLGHTSWIREIAFSPNGLTLACVDSEKVLQLWDVDTGKPIKIMSKYIYRVDGLAFTSDGETLLLSSQGFFQSWNVSTGLRNYNIRSDSLREIAFSPDGNTIATIGSNGLYLWKGTSGEFITELGDYDWGNHAIAFSPDGNTLVCGGIDGLTLWDTISWEPKLSIAGHNIFMKEIDLHPNRNIMASISYKRIYFWDTTTWNLENEFHIELFSQQWDLDFNPDGTTLATIVHGEIVIWEMSSGTPLAVLNSVNTDNWTGGVGFTSIEFSSDGKILAAGNYNRTIQLWYKGRTRKGTLNGHTLSVNSIAFHPNNRLLVSGSHDNTVKLWNVDSESPIFTLIGHSDSVNTVAFNPDGTYIASGSADKSIILWDVDTGDYNKTFIGHTDEVLSIAFSPDGNTLVSSGKRGDPTVRLWDVDTGELKKTLIGHVQDINDIAFCSDGEILVSISYDGTMLIWDFNSLNEVDKPTKQVAEDVNKDGNVNIQDLIFVASNLGQSGSNNPADLNDDEEITIEDLLIVAAVLEDVANAPTKFQPSDPILSFQVVQQWLNNSHKIKSNLPVYQNGITVLEMFLRNLMPNKTALLKNYPNPFNPETWIPYQLHQPANVSICIYSSSGEMVRTLELGYQSSGIYQDIRKAAYWDGKNEIGESVASGVYFYTMHAGQFTAIQRMVIRK